MRQRYRLPATRIKAGFFRVRHVALFKDPACLQHGVMPRGCILIRLHRACRKYNGADDGRADPEQLSELHMMNIAFL